VRLLDLCSGSGGAAVGYALAGFDVLGVDIVDRPRYPFPFVRADALTFPLDGFDVVHASPPCQGYSTQTARRDRHPRLIGEIRERLVAAGAPYVIENVEAARWAMIDPVRLCGSSFGLDLRRHRLFESNLDLTAPPCDHGWQTPRFQSLDRSMVLAGRLASVVGVHGHINYTGEYELRCRAMGIEWMTNDELVEAIPPVYTEHLGRQIAALLREAAA
jgi:DNA (cytosine-5)-methyltransferase 1